MLCGRLLSLEQIDIHSLFVGGHGGDDGIADGVDPIRLDAVILKPLLHFSASGLTQLVVAGASHQEDEQIGVVFQFLQDEPQLGFRFGTQFVLAGREVLDGQERLQDLRGRGRWVVGGRGGGEGGAGEEHQNGEDGDDNLFHDCSFLFWLRVYFFAMTIMAAMKPLM